MVKKLCINYSDYSHYENLFSKSKKKINSLTFIEKFSNVNLDKQQKCCSTC